MFGRTRHSTFIANSAPMEMRCVCQLRSVIFPFQNSGSTNLHGWQQRRGSFQKEICLQRKSGTPRRTGGDAKLQTAGVSHCGFNLCSLIMTVSNFHVYWLFLLCGVTVQCFHSFGKRKCLHINSWPFLYLDISVCQRYVLQTSSPICGLPFPSPNETF